MSNCTQHNGATTPARVGSLDMHTINATVQRAVAMLGHDGVAEGANCVLYAKLTAAMIDTIYRVPATVQVGAAAWRIGPGDGDCVTHAPIAKQRQFGIVHGPAAPLHAWVQAQVADAQGNTRAWLIDTTTHQLPSKAKALQACDGVATTCTWAPPWLAMPADLVSDDINAAVQASDAPAFAYHLAPAAVRAMFLSEAQRPYNVALVRQAALEAAYQGLLRQRRLALAPVPCA